MKPSRPHTIFMALLVGCFVPFLLAAKDPAPIFFHSRDSDEWVDHSIHVQQKYVRVLLVDASDHPPHQISVPALRLNSRDHVSGRGCKYRVFARFRTLQEAADAAQGGDLVAMMPGTYAGFLLEGKPSAGDRRYIHFKAMGDPGDVVINQPSRIPDWMMHSGYVTDGSDNSVIRRNVFSGSNSGGLQCNLDSVSSFRDVIKNANLQGYPKEQPTGEWAVGVMKLAPEKFGENNFPDGRGVNFIIEDNVMNENGKAGGGSLNLADLQDSLIQNNLIYNNRNQGIAQWNDANPYDQAYVDPGPSSPEQVKGPDDLPLWGCHGNVVRNNTVLMNNPQRAAMQARNGIWGTKMRNNIFINDQPSSIEIFNTSIYRLDSTFNVLNTLNYTGMADTLKALAIQLPEGSQTVSGITQGRAAGEFVRYGSEPWVIIEGKWWRLNPNRPDFRPRADSKLFSGWGDPKQLPARDLSGHRRTGPSVGAYAPSENAAHER